MRLAAAYIGLVSALIAAGQSGAMPPPQVSNFAPYSVDFRGPGLFCLSGFSIELSADEFAVTRQTAPWSNSSVINLHEGQMQIMESSSGRAAGRRYRKAGQGRLLRRQEANQIIYFYDDGLPGVTSITGPTMVSDRTSNRLLNRVQFMAPHVGATPCMQGKRSQ